MTGEDLLENQKNQTRTSRYPRVLILPLTLRLSSSRMPWT